MSLDDECVSFNPVNEPNCDNATTRAQRCAAQYGQYSAPTYRTSGFPFDPTRGARPVETLVGPDNPAGTPTAPSVVGCTDVTAFWIAAGATTAPESIPPSAPTRRGDVAGVVPDPKAITTNVTMTRTTRTMGPIVHHVRRLGGGAVLVVVRKPCVPADEARECWRERCLALRLGFGVTPI